MPEILKILTALVTAAFGVYSYVQPDAIAEASHFSLDNVQGRTEFRIAFGGFFAGFGLAAILLSGDGAYQALGFAYLLVFALRVASVFIEGKEQVVTPAYMAFGAIELLSGIILAWPQ